MAARLLFMSNQMIMMEVQINQNLIFITIVHAQCTMQARRTLWQDLLELKLLISGPWVWGWDFNTIRRLDERIGGRPLMLNFLEEFNDCIHTCGMNDVPTSRGGSSPSVTMALVLTASGKFWTVFFNRMRL